MKIQQFFWYFPRSLVKSCTTLLHILVQPYNPVHMRAIEQGSLAKWYHGFKILNVPRVKGQLSVQVILQNLVFYIATFYNHAKIKQGTLVKLLSYE